MNDLVVIWIALVTLAAGASYLKAAALQDELTEIKDELDRLRASNPWLQ